MIDKPKNIIHFDGVCNLCNGAVQFIIKRDPEKKFKFASLQSQAGQSLLKEHRLSTTDLNTIVYIKDAQHFTKSTAGLQVLKQLGGVYKLFYFFIIIPKPIRDFFYRLISKSRYSLFGKRDQCMIPSPETKDRFIADEMCSTR